MIKYLRVFFLTTFLCLLATTAFAATASAVPVVIALTPTTVVIALLAVLAGYGLPTDDDTFAYTPDPSGGYVVAYGWNDSTAGPQLTTLSIGTSS